MWWRKRKRMIDIRKLQKKGIKIPEEKNNVINSNGFVELEKNTPTLSDSSESGGIFGFMDNAGHEKTDSEELRKISSQISDLDNKLYKLEQRIELIEKKLGIL